MKASKVYLTVAEKNVIDTALGLYYDKLRVQAKGWDNSLLAGTSKGADLKAKNLTLQKLVKSAAKAVSA